jgi:hypothetical protein
MLNSSGAIIDFLTEKIIKNPSTSMQWVSLRLKDNRLVDVTDESNVYSKYTTSNPRKDQQKE